MSSTDDTAEHGVGNRPYLPDHLTGGDLTRAGTLTQPQIQYLRCHRSMFSNVLDRAGSCFKVKDIRDLDGYSKSWLLKSAERELIQPVAEDERGHNEPKTWIIPEEVIERL
jgi:hypothetical protein